MFKNRKFLIAAAAALALQLASPGSSHAQDRAAFNMPEDAVLFTAMGKDYTVGEFEEIIRFAPPQALSRLGGGMVELEQFHPDRVEAAAFDFVTIMKMAEKFKESDIPRTEQLDIALDRDLPDIEFRTWLQIRGILDVGEPTDAQLQALYDERKEEFRVWEELSFKHIFFSTYQEYIVKDGDSLESIATEISGDPEKAKLILNGEEPPKVRAEVMETVDGGELSPRPLQVGEMLRVPMGPEAAEEVRQRALEVKAMIGEDMTFDEAAEEFSETNAEQKGRTLISRPERDNKPILDAIRETFVALEDGGISDPIRTKHGFQIMLREKYQAPGYRSLEDMKDRLVQTWINTERSDKYLAVIQKYWNANPDIVEIDQDILMNAENEENAQAVVFQIEDVKYIGEQVVRDFPEELADADSFEKRRSMLTKLRMIQTETTKHDFEQSNMKETDEFKARYAWREGLYLSQLYRRHALQEFEVEVTEEEIAAKFEENKDSFRKQQAAEVWQLSFGPKEGDEETSIQDAQSELAQLISSVGSLEDFQELAAKHSIDEFSETGGQRGLFYFHSDDGMGRQVIQRADENSVYGPVNHNGMVKAYWVGKKVNGSEPTLEKFRPVVKNLIENDARKVYEEELRAGYAEEAGFEYQGG